MAESVVKGVDVSLACELLPSIPRLVDKPNETHIVLPGDVITNDPGYMRGHGTYLEDEQLLASIAGKVERVNKLITVKPPNSRYTGEIGDVVIGRVKAVEQKRWRIETFSRLDSALQLSSVNLPGGELRRKTEEDERLMRDYLAEGDLISAEVHSCKNDGTLSLHTRSLKYGKLGQGVLVRVPSSLVQRSKTHFHHLPIGASLILGNNGLVWISATQHVQSETGGHTTSEQPISVADRESIARLRNCVLALAGSWCLLFDTSILYAYEASTPHEIKDILKPTIMRDIAETVRQRLKQER